MKRGGFTLIEILISMAILSLVMGGIYGVFNTADKTYNEDMGLVDLQQETRQAMDSMLREIRQASRPYANINANGSLTFSIPTMLNITYQLDTSSHQIIRQLAGINKVLSNDIQSLSFCWWDGASCCTSGCGNLEVLQVSITSAKVARRPVTFSLTERVKLRN